VTSARVLAVASTPAEAEPGASVAFATLFVDANGDVGGPFDWAFCKDREPLAELGPVSSRCSQRTGDFFVEIGNASTATGAVPQETCTLFGPDVPPPTAGEPPGRPVDPDATGGFYQPVRLAAGDATTVERVRIDCGLTAGTDDQIADLKKRYHVNTNPSIDALTEPTLGTLVTADLGATTVAPSQRLVLRATWADCDPSATTCTGAEGYPSFDQTSHLIVDHRETMRVSWFASGGDFDDDRTGRDATDPTPFSENGWTAPSSPGTVRMWVVVRDDRGGAGWKSYVVTVQ
jgi:hypothetical protein